MRANEMLVWTLNLLKGFRSYQIETSTQGLPENSPSPLDLLTHKFHKDTNTNFDINPHHNPHHHLHHAHHLLNPITAANPNINLPPNTKNTSPSCTFHHPSSSSTYTQIHAPQILTPATWAFLSALLSHRIQALHRDGVSAMQTIDVGEELESFGRIGEESGMESFAPLGMSGLFLGLVYEGRDEGDGMGEKENGEEKGEMKRCVEQAIRGVYEVRELSGWMELGGDEEEDGEWVSYLIYWEG